VGVIFGTLTNFLNGDSDAKLVAAELGLADVVHKLWAWCCVLSSLLEGALKMLSTFTASCLSGKWTQLTGFLGTALPSKMLTCSFSSISVCK
jgi:hypothetical protein